MIKAKKKDKRGGARPGAGRPIELEGGEYTPTYLDAKTRSFMSDLGEGNLSLGIRRAAEALAGKDLAVLIKIVEKEET